MTPRADDPARWADAARSPQVHCLGKCYAAPAVASRDADSNPRPHVECRALERARALARLEFVVIQDLFMNETRA